MRGRLRDLSLRFRDCSWARRSARVRAMVLTTGFNRELNMGMRLMSLTRRPDQISCPPISCPDSIADSAFVRAEWGSQLSEVVDGIGVGSAGMDALSTISAEGSGIGRAGTDGLTTISAEGSGVGSDNGAGDSTAG